MVVTALVLLAVLFGITAYFYGRDQGYKEGHIQGWRDGWDARREGKARIDQRDVLTHMRTIHRVQL